MVLEQEIASVIAYALKKANDPTPYYYNVPEDFVFPAMYFPQPEIDTRGETFNSYAMDFSWYVNVFDKTTVGAYGLGLAVLSALKDARNLVPLIDAEGKETGELLRLDDPTLKPVADGVVQIGFSWRSRRPYDCEAVIKMQTWATNENLIKEE